MIALVTGGASCGKSRLAEALSVKMGGRLVYLAAMRPYGEEGAQRVARHRAQRDGKGFETVECYDGLGPVIASGRLHDATVLLEDLGNTVANALFSDEGTRALAEVASQLKAEIAALAKQCAHLVVVGNEVAADGIEYAEETQIYQRVIGSMASWVAMRSDMVVESCSGLPVVVRQSGALSEDPALSAKVKEGMGL